MQNLPQRSPDGKRRNNVRPALDDDDLETLRRLTAQACHVCYLLTDAAGLKETRRAAFTLADELASWHRRVEPEAYGREAGGRP